ncbi:hypothetical protein AGMMS49928_00940 [Spirochaetia bacterium]|nr:hypothetical protein AGMMS49928_00940 [Spirochaetia bacterium]
MRGNLFQGAWNNMTDEQRQHLAEKIQKHRHEHHGFDPRDGLNLRTQNASGDEKTEKKKDE